MQFLVDHGAEVDIVDALGKSPLDLALARVGGRAPAFAAVGAIKPGEPLKRSVAVILMIFPPPRSIMRNPTAWLQ